MLGNILLIVSAVVCLLVATFWGTLRKRWEKAERELRIHRLATSTFRAGVRDELGSFNWRHVDFATKSLLDLGFSEPRDLIGEFFLGWEIPSRQLDTLADPAQPGRQPRYRRGMQEIKTFTLIRVMQLLPQGCVACLIVQKSSSASGPPAQTRPQLAIMSFAEDGGWNYMTAFGYEGWHTRLWNMPRQLHTLLPGQIQFQYAISTHLRRRQQIASAGQFVWKRDPGAPDVIRFHTERRRNIVNMANKMTPLSLLWKQLILGKGTRKREWLGELQGKL